MVRFSKIAIAIAVTFCACAAEADPSLVNLVVPGNLATVEGNGNNSIPFDIGTLGLSSGRYQQAYAASSFAGMPANSGYITRIAFRVDGAFWSFTNTLPDIQVDLSTTPQPVAGLSSTFSQNVGADDTVVYARGPMTLCGTGGASPNPFDVAFNLTTPFFYNPTLGNLLMDVRNYGAGSTVPFDATRNSGDGVSREFTWISGGVMSGVADGPQTSSTWGLVTRFTVEVPEPSCVKLLAVGALGFLGRRRRETPR